MPKTLQAPALIAVIVLLSILRLVPSVDPIGPLIRSIFSRESTQNTEDTGTETQIKALEEKVSALEGELEFKQSAKQRLAGAHVLSKTAVSFRQALRIDIGSQAGVRSDAPVFHRGHLIGITQAVESNAATVLLIGDPDVSVPVKIGTAQGIVRAYAGGVLVDQVVGEVSSGEPVLTSGIGGLYPPGLLVGSIGSEVERDLFGQYVLERPSKLYELEMVQVGL